MRIRFGIPSGPDAFDGFMSWSSFSTPFSVMVSFGMGSSMCLVVCGMAVDGFKLLDQYVVLLFAVADQFPFALQWGNTNVVVFSGFYVFPERFGVVGFQPF